MGVLLLVPMPMGFLRLVSFLGIVLVPMPNQETCLQAIEGAEADGFYAVCDFSEVYPLKLPRRLILDEMGAPVMIQ